MSPLVAVAAGRDAADTLWVSCNDGIARGDCGFVRHRDLAVAWSTTSPWIDVHDDGEVLVVLDGRLHDRGGPVGQARLLAQRFRRDGVDVARGLLGDFVLIVVDRRSGVLLVARDPIGVRPWYQATDGGRFAGASDLATLVRLPWVNTQVNEPIAIEYLAAVPESRGETLYRGVTTLRPGRTWHLDGARARTFLHHRWAVRPELDISWDDAVERCRAALDDSVRARLEVATAATSELSGGLDSSAVVGTAALLGRDDLLVGRLVFDSPRADERSFSDAVINHWGVPAVSRPPWIPAGEELTTMTRRLRRPPPGPNFTMFVGLHRALLADGRPDSLTGLGGDDAFAAMSVGSRVVSAAQLRQAALLGRLARHWARRPAQAWGLLLRPTLGHIAARWRRARRPSWVSAAAAAQADLGASRRGTPRATGVDAIDQRLASLTCGYMAWILEEGAVLVDEVGRRASHPFLDPRFVLATYGLDPWWPTRGGYDRALEVAAFADRLPTEVANRRSKVEFSEVFWPQVLDEQVLTNVRSGPVSQLGWLDPDGFDSLVQNARRGMANAAIPLSRCVWLDYWIRTQ